MKNRENVYKITSIILMLDQFIKLIVTRNLNLYEEVKIIPKFFSILYVKNTGAAFSILKDSSFLLIILSVIFVLLLDNYIKKEKHLSLEQVISFGLIMGGIFGNLMDRIIHHSVIDYLSFTFGKYYFPIFNLADTAIVCGVILYGISIILEKKERLK